MDSNSKYPEFAARFIEASSFIAMDSSPQDDFGKVLSVSGPMVNNYRNGRKLPSMATACRVCEITGAELQWLMLGTGPKKGADSLTIENLWESLPKKEQEEFFSRVIMRAVIKGD